MAFFRGLRKVPARINDAAARFIPGARKNHRCRCFIADDRRLIMPAFGSYPGALSVRSEAFAGLFGEFHVWMIGDKAVHRFPAAQVR